MAGHGVEGLGHVFHAEVGDPDRRDAEPLLHHVGQIHGGARALDDVQGRAMAAFNVVHPAVAGDVGDHLDADTLEIFADQPDFAGEIEIAEDVDGVFADTRSIAGADQPGHGIAGRLVASPLVAFKPFRLYRQHRDAFFRRDLFADRLQVVADQADNAGRIDEGRFRLVAVDQFVEGLLEFFFAAEDHIQLLEIGGKGEPVQFRPRR